MKSTIQELQKEIQKQQHQHEKTATRLRHQRDQYRSTAKELANQVAQLQPKEEEFYDSDDEEKDSVEKKADLLLRRTKSGLQASRFAPASQESQIFNTENGLQARFAPASQHLNTKTGLRAKRSTPDSQVFNTQIDTAPKNEPVSQEFHESSTKYDPQTRFTAVSPTFNTHKDPEISGFPVASQGSNKHYPDVPDFHGDSTKWEAWQLHLDAKFRASAMLFPSEQSRIDYIRDHCKSTAFDIIKARCLDKTNPYITAHEILEDLDNMYGEFDPFGTADARLHSPDFGMQKKETFNEFLAKFTATIAPLQLPEQQKISQLTRTITRRLRWHTMGQKPKVFREYTKQLRQCDLNLRHLDQQYGRHHHDSEDDYSTDQSCASKSSHGSRNSNRSSSRCGSNRSRGYFGANKHSEATLERLRQEGKCFRCQKTGHMAIDDDAPCRMRRIEN